VELQALSTAAESVSATATVEAPKALADPTPTEATEDKTVDIATVKATMSTKMASNAAKIAIDAAKSAAQHAQEAQTAVDTAKIVTDVSSEGASSSAASNKNVVATDKDATSSSASSTTVGTPMSPGKATEKSSEKHADSPSSGSNSIAVPAQVTQGMHIAPTQVGDASDTTLKKTGESGVKQKEATQAANTANKIAQEASKVAQVEAANAARNAAQAAEASAENAVKVAEHAAEVVEANKVDASISPATETSPVAAKHVQAEAEKVADSKAHEAQEAAMRAAVAAKVAEQKAHEAAAKASEATEASVNATTTEDETEKATQVEIPKRGLIVSLLLGLTITMLMLFGLLTLFACGDKLLKSENKDVMRGFSSKA